MFDRLPFFQMNPSIHLLVKAIILTSFMRKFPTISFAENRQTVHKEASLICFVTFKLLVTGEIFSDTVGQDIPVLFLKYLISDFIQHGTALCFVLIS